MINSKTTQQGRLVMDLGKLNLLMVVPFLGRAKYHYCPSVNLTLYARVFHTNVVLAAFSSYMYVTCTWKKLPNSFCSYEKFVRKNVDEIDTKLPIKMKLDLKVVKINLKIILMLL